MGPAKGYFGRIGGPIFFRGGARSRPPPKTVQIAQRRLFPPLTVCRHRPRSIFPSSTCQNSVDKAVHKAHLYRPSQFDRNSWGSTPSSVQKSRTTTPFCSYCIQFVSKRRPLFCSPRSSLGESFGIDITARTFAFLPSRKVGNGHLSATPHESSRSSINSESLPERRAR